MAIRTLQLDYGTIPKTILTCNQVLATSEHYLPQRCHPLHKKRMNKIKSIKSILQAIIMKRYRHIHNQVGLLRLLNQKQNNQPITRD